METDKMAKVIRVEDGKPVCPQHGKIYSEDCDECEIIIEAMRLVKQDKSND